jgi:hypothetical protein
VAVPHRRVGPHVLQEVVDHLAQRDGVPHDLHDIAGLERDGPLRPHHAGRLDGLHGQSHQLDELGFGRWLLVETRQDEQVLHQAGHAAGLVLYARHEAAHVVAALGGRAREELGIGRHGGDGRAKLVGRVRDESPQSGLRGLQLVKSGLDALQHHVERLGHPAHFGARIGMRDAMDEVTAGDRLRRPDHVSQRTQTETHEPQPDEDGDGERSPGDRSSRSSKRSSVLVMPDVGSATTRRSPPGSCAT